MDTYTKNQILETTGNVKRLVNIYRKWDYNKTMRMQLMESVNSLERIVDRGVCETELQKELSIKIRKKLGAKGIKVDSIFYSKNKKNKEIVALTGRVKTGCKKTKIISDVISDVMGTEMVPVKDCRGIVTENIDEYVFTKQAEFYELHGQANKSKDKGVISGDSYTFFETRMGDFVMAISDGMGSGEKAAKDSGEVMDFIEEYLDADFGLKNIPAIINDAFMKSHTEEPVTIDIAHIDMDSGIIRMLKAGGATTFIRRNNEVKQFCPSSLPLGVVNEIEPYVYEEQLLDGDYIIMISDGVADSLPFYDKEKQLANIILQAKCNTPEGIANHILDECLYYNGGKNLDDMTVLVAGIFRIKNLQRDI